MLYYGVSQSMGGDHSFCMFLKKCKLEKILISIITTIKHLLMILSRVRTQQCVVEWSARLARKRVFRVRRLLAPSSMMHIRQ